MARSLVILVLFFVLGIVLGRYYFSIPVSAVLLGGVSTWSLLNIYRKREGLQVFIPMLLLFLTAGSLACSLFLQGVGGNILQYTGVRCSLVGMVVDEPRWRDGDVVFTLRPEKIVIKDEEKPVSGRVRVVLRLNNNGFNSGAANGEKNIVGSFGNAADGNAGYFSLAYGHNFSLQGVIYEPGEKRNPGGFDYRGYLETQGIAANFYGLAESAVHLGVSQELSIFRYASLQVKENMSGVLRTFMPEREGNLLSGMLFGERSALDAGMEKMFRSSGISHLLALSGLHVGLVAAAVWLLCRRLGLEGLALLVVTLCILFFYVYMTGLRPSALRAFIMFALAAGAASLCRERDLPNALAAAALVTLVYNPMLLFTVSFQLSYAATGAIIALTPNLESKLVPLLSSLAGRVSWFPAGKTASLISVTLAAQLGVIPLTAFYFGEISLVALVTNLLVLPAMSFVLGIGLIAALLGLLFPVIGSFVALAAYPLLLYIVKMAELLGSFPFSSRTVFPPHYIVLLFFYGFLFFLILGGGEILISFFSRFKNRLRPSFYLILFLLLALVFSWPGHALRDTKELEIVFLDVGQGDAAYINTPGGINILIDGGGRPAFTGDVEGVGHRVVLPFLRERRVSKLDLVVVSHPHEDHFGGLIPVLQEMPVSMLLTNFDEPDSPNYRYLLELAQEKNVPRTFLSAGDMLQLEQGVSLKVLAPPPEPFRGTGSDINNNSLVKKLSFREAVVLFTGDIEEAAAASLLEKDLLCRAQILKVPHHGGYLPNLPEVLEKVQPEIAVISTGKNSFGHPHPHTIETLVEKDVTIYRTDQHGGVSMLTDGYTWKVETMLETQQEEIFRRDSIYPFIATSKQASQGRSLSNSAPFDWQCLKQTDWACPSHYASFRPCCSSPGVTLQNGQGMP